MPRDGPAYSQIPIPTYDEAISSRPQSTQSDTSPAHAVAEGVGLISPTRIPQSASNGYYRPPTVESARSSFESVTTLSSNRSSRDDDAVRRDMEEFEVDDTQSNSRRQRRQQSRNKLINSITNSFRSFTLPSISPHFHSITRRLPAWPEHLKPSLPMIARLVAISLLLGLVYMLVVMGVFRQRSFVLSQQFLPESVRDFAQKSINTHYLDQNLRQMTVDDHIAGTRGDFFLANWVESRFAEYKLDVVYQEDYKVLLNYPGERIVSMGDDQDLKWKMALEEDRTNPELDQHQSATFFGHSINGEVTAPLVYANYGLDLDFDWLRSIGINVNGTIVILRRSGYEPYLAQKIINAQRAGALAVLIYPDPADDTYAREHPDTVHRGSVTHSSLVLGDPLTPGSPSLPDVPRLNFDEPATVPGLPSIPALPISWRDANPLVTSLARHGVRVPDNWAGRIPNVNTYWTGNTSTSPTVTLRNHNDIVAQQTIRNVHALIRGAEAGTIHISAPRDALCFGALDSGVASAVLVEVSRVFGEMINIGWRPRRSIQLNSWDASSFNFAGSTESIEQRIREISSTGLANINIGAAAVSGKSFRATGSPLFSRPLHHVLDRVTDPTENTTLSDLWNKHQSSIRTPSASGDYAAFQHIAGTSSIDLAFINEEDPHAAPVPGTCHDTLSNMLRLDPMLSRTMALAQTVVLLALELADEPLITYDVMNYANAVTNALSDLQADLAHLTATAPHAADDDDDTESAQDGDKNKSNMPSFDLKALSDAVHLLMDNSAEFNQRSISYLEKSTLASSTATFEDANSAAMRLDYNARITRFEADLLDSDMNAHRLLRRTDNDAGSAANQKDRRIVGRNNEPGEGDEVQYRDEPAQYGQTGLRRRRQYKHVLFAPHIKDANRGVWFPGIRDALEEEALGEIQEEVEKIARIVTRAARGLLD